LKRFAGNMKSGQFSSLDEGCGKNLPSRADILAFIARERDASSGKGKIGKRDIARAFNLKGDARIALKDLLRGLKAEGAIAKRGKSLQKPGLLPKVVLATIAGRDRDGDLFAEPAEWAEGPVPRIVVTSKAGRRHVAPAPGLGDRALLRVEPLTGAGPGEPAYWGRVIKLLPREKSRLLGIFRADTYGGGRIMPVDKKNLNRGELLVAPGDQGAGLDGDLVAFEPLRAGRFGLPAAKVRERLGAIEGEKFISLIAVHAHQIPHVFAHDTLAEADQALPASMSGREDWRAIPFVTIDPEDAKDHDDAVYAERDGSANNPGGFILRVAIADVAAYVRPSSALDIEALDRGNSVYFPDRVVPMLPERISNELCSLRPAEDRPAIAARIVIAADGRKVTHSFHRVMMRSGAKLSYAQVQAAIDHGPRDDKEARLHTRVLVPLYEAYNALKIARDQRGPLDLELPERKLILDEAGKVKTVIIPPRLNAHRLIEEYMILANVAAAETLEARNRAFIYRVHDEPSLEKLNNLAEFLTSLGIKLAKGTVMRAGQFNRILARVKGTDNEHIVNEVVLRTQAQAEYATENYGHFGLNLRRYTHFTSPIRRYADLIVHRALITALGLGGDGLGSLDGKELAEIAARISAAERRAMAAERETFDRLIAAHLAEKAGAEFMGRISGATSAGLFVRLDETGADGFIPAATLGDDYFRHDPARHALIGSTTGQIHRLGDVVTVRLVEAAPLAGALRFELLRESGPPQARKGSANAKGRARKKLTKSKAVRS
jgi:ribonuclease R